MACGNDRKLLANDIPFYHGTDRQLGGFLF